MPAYRVYLVLAVAAAAALSWWLAPTPPAAEQTPTLAPGAAREIDYYIRGLDVTRMSEDGRPDHRLVADDLRHFVADDTAELDTPRMTVFQDGKPPWQITSDKAWVSADGTLVLLTGEVLIERSGNATERPVRILTRDLRVQPEQDYAETDEGVRVESEDDWIEAVGMQAWLRPPSRIKFLSQVTSLYVPR